MAYTLTIGVHLGSAKTGLTLHARLYDTAGVLVGGSVTTGFVETVLPGDYTWTGTIPTGHRGSVVFFDAGNTALASTSINPEEAGTVIALADGVITASAFAASAITAASLKDDAVTKIAAGVAAASEDMPFSANVVSVIGTPLTESGTGRSAAALSKFLDVATPVLTTASVNQSVDVAAVKTVTDRLATALELDAGNYRFTAAALATAPGGTSSIDVTALAAAIVADLPSGADIAAAIISALTAAGVLDTDTGVEGEQTVEMMLGEDHSIGVTLPDDMTGATFSFALARTLADALAETGTVASVANADITVAGQTVTVPAAAIGTAALVATTDASQLWYAVRRTDAGNRRVVRWGPWVVVGA